jgi:hypothetical protein
MGGMMTEREEYEFAAKAAGYELEWDIGDYVHPIVSGNYQLWLPKDVDGDAFRLMVDVGKKYSDVFQMYLGNEQVESQLNCDKSCGLRFVEDHNNDPYAATRRAIFNAAVAIGHSMK